MECVLYKIKSNHDNVRSDKIIGECNSLPEIGRIFRMYAEPFDAFNPYTGEVNSFRYIGTTEIQSLKELENGRLEFQTQNSIYQLEIL